MKSKFIWENKLKADPAPEVGGGRFLGNFNCFLGKTYIWENKLKSDPAPEVGGYPILEQF